VSLLLAAGVDKDKAANTGRNNTGRTPLYVACQNGRKEVVSMLLEASVDTDKTTKQGLTPLCIACQKGHKEIVSMLLEFGVDKDKAGMNIRSPGDGLTPLTAACWKDHREIVSLLLEAGADKDKADSHGTTPLCIACENEHKEVISLLLEAGANTDKTDSGGYSPLHVMCQFTQSKEIVSLLLAAGADKDKRTDDENGSTPLYIACESNHKEIVSLLLEAGADKDKATNDGFTPLYTACERYHKEMVSILLKAGADKDKADIDGTTPLFIACEKDHREIVSMLLAAGADKDKATNDGWTPLFYACQNGYTEVVSMLLEAGADKDKATNNDVTPLLVACHPGHTEVVSLLVEAGADQNKADDCGATPLLAACSKNHTAIISLLLQSGARGHQNLDLASKQSWIQTQLSIVKRAAGHNSAPLAITVQRGRLLEGICGLSTANLTHGIDVTFHGENGTGDGVRREYLKQVVEEFVDPNAALLSCVEQKGPHAHRVQPNPESGINPDHLSYYEMLGKLIGVGLLQGGCLPVRFTMPFLKQLLKLPLQPDDLKAVDPVLYKQKIVLLGEYSEETLQALDLTFSQEETSFGATRTVDLLSGAGGENEAVTTGNRSVYIKLLCHYLLTAKIKEQTAAVSRGLGNIIPECILHAMRTCLTGPGDFDIMIAGQPTIDLDDWKSNTLYEGGFTAESPQIDWLWTFLHKSDLHNRNGLLVFVTGAGAVPAGGFAVLPGYNGALHKFTVRKMALGEGESLDASLPKAQTCFNTLILPEYSSPEVLEAKLSLAICEGGSGFDEGAVAT